MKNPVMLSGLIMVILIVSGCTTNGGNDEMIVISDGSVIDPQICMEKGIADKVVVFHSPTCPACQNTIPVLEDLEDEVDVEFDYIDLATEKEEAEALGIMPTHIPTVIIKCKAYTGYKDKDTFKDLIGG